jgi:hypothetical protein
VVREAPAEWPDALTRERAASNSLKGSMTFEDPRRSQGQEFAQIAVDLRLKGLPPEQWGDFMRHRMAALALALANDDERRRWGSAVLEAYSDALEDTDALVLAVRQPQGRA